MLGVRIVVKITRRPGVLWRADARAREEGLMIILTRFHSGEPIALNPDLIERLEETPDTVVTFTYTFNSPGVYEYVCLAPCGPGMGLVGYMDGYVIVTSP